MALRPATEFGEASSDDLSSEWDSCSESDSSPVTGIPFTGYPACLPRRKSRGEGSGDAPDSNADVSSGNGDRSSEEDVGCDGSQSRTASKRVS